MFTKLSFLGVTMIAGGLDLEVSTHFGPAEIGPDGDSVSGSFQLFCLRLF